MNIASFALKTCLHNRKFKMLLLLSENKFEKGKVLHIETNLVKQRESLPKIYIASHKTFSRGLATNFLGISGQLDFLMAIQFHFLYCYCFYFRGNIEGQFFYIPALDSEVCMAWRQFSMLFMFSKNENETFYYLFMNL